MQCREVRELADAFLSDQLLVETTHEIVRHLETCPACREDIAARRALRAKLQSAFANARELGPRPEFTAELADRLRLPERGASRRSFIKSWWALAAGVLAAAGGGLFVRNSAQRSRLAAMAAQAAGDHQNCAVKFNLSERPISLQEAAIRFDHAYAALVTLDPPAGLSDGPMLDRHSCVYQGQRFAHVVFRDQGRLVSLLVTNQVEGSIPSAPELLPPAGGFHVAAFAARRHIVFVVSDLSDSQTLQITKALARPVAQRLESA
jgi:hypothetical protein